MKILACVGKSYYRDPIAVNPNFYNFVTVPLALGHSVTFFDSSSLARIDKDMPDDLLCSAVRGGGYDVVIIETRLDEFSVSAILEAKKYSIILGFNSDDDFRWKTFSSKYAEAYTYSITTYRHIYKFAKAAGHNVIFCPWACSGMYDGYRNTKDINFSFAGGVHGHRLKRLINVKSQLPIQVFGKGVHKGNFDQLTLSSIAINKFRNRNGTRKMIRDYVLRYFNIDTGSISYEEANAIWGRSKISFTPLSLEMKHLKLKQEMLDDNYIEIDKSDLKLWESPLQIKGRVFDMGLSGTLMLCDSNEAIREFYLPGDEYIEFSTMEDMVEKVKYYLAHEKERNRIAKGYYKRTLNEHLWKHRWQMIIDSL